jgi:hypothetical protein
LSNGQGEEEGDQAMGTAWAKVGVFNCTTLGQTASYLGMGPIHKKSYLS